ncbi:exonuclease domain-containing protein [Paraburkholderia tropica]|uniref:exonuclease domain-containing protein n=1 Tax=Paraburkholderia tropica TaxID=92647 RepID=UPI001F36F693|nr:exonuclease domain-containing protein [Paraburkholderia tropica]
MQPSAESLKPRSSATEAIAETAIVAVVDTETTGLDAHDEPISLGIVLYEVDLPKGGLVREIDAYYGTRQPAAPISPGAFAVHGISAAELSGKQIDTSHVLALLRQADYVIAHHAEFDGRMLGQLFPEIHRKRWRCSYRQIWWTDHVQVANRKLDTICAALGVPRPSPHNALDDCRALAGALFTRTGKTQRSRTFLGVALSKGDFPVAPAPQPQARRSSDTPKKPVEWALPTYVPPTNTHKRDMLIRLFVYGMLAILVGTTLGFVFTH